MRRAWASELDLDLNCSSTVVCKMGTIPLCLQGLYENRTNAYKGPGIAEDSDNNYY